MRDDLLLSADIGVAARMIGGAIGAYLLASAPGELVRPFIGAYLLTMGLIVLWRALHQAAPLQEVPRHLTLSGVPSDRTRRRAALRHRLRQPVEVLRHHDHHDHLRVGGGP